MVLTILILQELEPVGSYLYQVGQVAVDLLDLCLQTRHELVGLVLIEFQDALHLDFEQFQDIVLSYLADKLWVIRCESLVDMFANGIYVRCLFKFLVFIDTLLDEDTLQTLEVQLF